MTTSALPVACTLGAGDYRERLAWIAELNRTALRHHAHDGRRLVLTYAPGSGDRVRELVRRERECCAFLSFTLHEDPDTVRLTIDAPEAAGASAAVLLEPFTASESAAPTAAGADCAVACACSGESAPPGPEHRAAGMAVSSASAARTG